MNILHRTIITRGAREGNTQEQRSKSYFIDTSLPSARIDTRRCDVDIFDTVSRVRWFSPRRIKFQLRKLTGIRLKSARAHAR